MPTMYNFCTQVHNQLTEEVPLDQLLFAAKTLSAWVTRSVAEVSKDQPHYENNYENNCDETHRRLCPGHYERLLLINTLLLSYLRNGKKDVRDQIDLEFEMYAKQVEDMIDQFVFPDAKEIPKLFMFQEGRMCQYENDNAVRVACEHLKRQIEGHQAMRKMIYRLRERIAQKCKASI